ncbi:DEAD-like helicases superfamily protein [Metarhizium robertsii]|uniref:ATP-dependent RNA helicase n=2 Tax=Metarhizium robertsii TaxID=568076 RepID=E9F1L9_METRA|nr:DEAD-like helicase [Metarhizium robertsii ARSEF 23]EFY98391.1 DEAD-like helicase [Metarhizium robertsii ARSEF 23]EXV01787.1 DEAD-like helicases superfamily protein [Metarhizium robertsii]
MLRQGFRHCAGLTSAVTRSVFFHSRTATPIAPRGVVSLARTPATFKSISYSSRFYSAEAAAVETKPIEGTVPSDVVNFADLSQAGVHRNLLDAITKDMRYEAMTPVQSKTINPALKGTDIVAQAKTGTGKTLAFLLPLLQRMIEEDPTLATRRASRSARSDDIRGIVLSPTRELAEQIAAEARRLTKYTGLVVQSAVGGTHKGSMLRQTQRQGCHLLVATPGRLNDLLQDPQSGIEAPNLAALVLDEADRMLDVGFEKELGEITRCLPSRNEKTRQTMLVSATIPDDVIRLARTMVRADDFEFVQTISENESLTHDRVPQHVVPLASWNNVFPSLFELIDRESAKAAEDRSLPPFKAIVYFNTTSLVEMGAELGFQRRRNGLMKTPTFSIQSQLTQNQRTKAADMFRHARSGVLFSSDVTARGMDFPNVTHVIQVDTPRDRESYIHRLGRTARQNKGGEGWLLLPPTSMGSARKLLRGLPLQPNKTLESFNFDAEEGAEKLPKYHQEAQDLTQSLPRKMLSSAYTSIFGNSTQQREELVEDLNLWTTVGWGWSEPPPVSHSWARNQGLLHTELNIQDRATRQDDRSGRREGRGPRRFDDHASSDPFADMGRRVRRDDKGFGRSSRGNPHRGSRGFRGSRESRESRESSF